MLFAYFLEFPNSLRLAKDMSPNPSEPVNCTERKRLNERISQLVTQLGLQIDTLQQHDFTGSVTTVEQLIYSVNEAAKVLPNANG